MTSASPPIAPGGVKTYRVGTLTYTLPQLLTLCGWLIWGDFCFMLMQAVLPSMLPVQLREIGISNTFISVVIGSLPGALNMVFNPLFSTFSDRFRSRWGRRIPFLFWAAPAIGILLTGVGYSRQLAEGLSGLAALAGFTLDARISYLSLLAVFVILFSVANIVVGSIYCYLLADVVPQAVIGRFLAVFRIASQLAGFVWGYFFLNHAETHSEIIYVSVSVIYTVSFLLMCWRVREGGYPDLTPVAVGAGAAVRVVRSYFKDCFTKPVYLWVFGATGVYMSLLSSVAFMILLGKDTVGLSQESVAHIVGWSSLAAVPVVIVAGLAVDRWNPLWVAVGVCVAGCAGAVAGHFFVDSERGYLVYSILFASAMAAYQVTQFPVYLMIFPGEKFGQFSSANALVGSASLVVVNLALGPFLDVFGSYKILLAWQAVGWLLVIVPLLFAFAAQRSHRSAIPSTSSHSTVDGPAVEPA